MIYLLAIIPIVALIILVILERRDEQRGSPIEYDQDYKKYEERDKYKYAWSGYKPKKRRRE